MRPDLAALFQNDDGGFGRKLLQADGGANPAGPAPTITTSKSMLSRGVGCTTGLLLAASVMTGRNCTRYRCPRMPDQARSTCGAR